MRAADGDGGDAEREVDPGDAALETLFLADGRWSVFSAESCRDGGAESGGQELAAGVSLSQPSSDASEDRVPHGSEVRRGVQSLRFGEDPPCTASVKREEGRQREQRREVRARYGEMVPFLSANCSRSRETRCCEWPRRI